MEPEKKRRTRTKKIANRNDSTRDDEHLIAKLCLQVIAQKDEFE